MSSEDIRMALAGWDKEDLVEGWIGLNSLLETSAVKREKAEARCVQLEEALKPFRNLAEIYDPECNGHFSDDYRVLVTLGMCRQARSALSPSEAPEKEE